MAGVWNPAGFNWLREKFSVARQDHGCGCPIFLTRRGTTRLPSNLGAIEEFFAGEGFQIVDCGRLNVREQIALASAATAIAGIHGAAMTNILWAHAGTPVLELFLPGYINACYEQIAFQGKLRYSGLLLGQADESSRLGGWIRAAMGTRV
jgi:capsular polysaccharide biosynthesis protein